MKFKVSIDQKSVSDTLKKLYDFGDAGKKAIAETTELIAQEVKTEALINISQNNIGYELSKEIGDIQVLNEGNPYQYSVNVTGVPMAAYIEFGTGAFIQIAPEWKDLAWSFYVNGKGMLHAKPYLYPAWRKVTPLYKVDLEKELEKLTKRF